MELKSLPTMVLFLFLIGLVLATGILVMDKFQRSARDTTTVVSTGYNLSVAGSKDFSQTYCLTVVSITNSSSASFDVSTYNAGWTAEDTCVMSYDAIEGCGGLATQYCNITYTYGASNDAATTGGYAITALTPIASSWLPLIITVMILAVVLGLVISSFGAGRNK